MVTTMENTQHWIIIIILDIFISKIFMDCIYIIGQLMVKVKVIGYLRIVKIKHIIFSMILKKIELLIIVGHICVYSIKELQQICILNQPIYG